MTAPVLAREGARIGGVLTTTAAFTCRTDSNGVNLSVEVSQGPTFANLVGAVTAGSLTIGNNYQATAYVSGLQPGRRYYWRIRADDGVGGVTYGTEPLTANTFKTLPDAANQVWRVGVTGCYCGAQQGANLSSAKTASNIARRILGLDLTAMLHMGDVYYADVGASRSASGAPIANGSWVDGTHAYQPNAWFGQVNTGATDGRKGTDDSTVARHRTNFITTIDAPLTYGQPYALASVMAAVPGWYMWDDHDLAWNDCSDLDGDEVVLSTAETNCLLNGHQASHEAFMNLNRDFVNQEIGRDFATEALGTVPNGHEYYYVDVPPARFVVLDCRSFRDEKTTTDTTAKTMLGATQKAWLKAHIADNPQRFLVICSPLELDSDHGWFENDGTTVAWDNWKGCSHERDEILNHIWSHGDASRTLFVCADTHNGHVATYRGPNNDRTPIYEIMASNGGWIPSGHGWPTGWSADIWRANETACASGNGGKAELIRIGQNNLTVIDGSPEGLFVKMVETGATGLSDRGGDESEMSSSTVVWSRWFR